MFHRTRFARFLKSFFLLLTLSVISSFLDVLPSYASFSLDPTYGNGGKVITSFGIEAPATDLALQSDGKAVVVGYNYNGSANWVIARYNTDGSLDSSFGTNGIVIQNFGFSNAALAVRIQTDGKIVVAGSDQNTSTHPWTVGRYNTNGTLDTTFGNNGIAIPSINGSDQVKLTALTLQSDGKIITAGYRDYDAAIVVRQNPDGSLDQTFGNGGIVAATLDGGFERTRSVTLQTDGKIVIFGDGGNADLFTYRFNTDGSIDTTFGSNGLVTESFGASAGATYHGLAIQPTDGKIVETAGYFPASGSHVRTYVIRYNPDGTHDSSFGSGGYVLNPFATVSIQDASSSLFFQSDGKIVLGGSSYDGSNQYFALRRLNADGTVDTSFGSNGSIITPVGSGGNSYISSIAFQADGKILAGGAASNGSYNDFALARYADIAPTINPISNTTINEGDTYTANGSFSDPNPNATSWTATVDYGDSSGTQSLALSGMNFSLSHQYKDEGTYTVTVKVTDNQGATGTGTATITVNNATPSVGAITVSTNPVQVNNATTATATFTDAGVNDTHTAKWNWGDGSTQTDGTVTESNGSGTVGSDSHTYTAAGVYTITLTVTDDDGTQPGTQTFQYVSVYNPTSQGLFSGGQRFTSPAGAYPQNSSLTGTVKFGLSYKYQGSMPVGDKQFTMNFNAANFTFNATTISSLVIANGIGTLTGTGTLNGSGSTYTFLVTGSESANTIRIQIKDSSNTVIYDTQPGAADTATPTTSVTGHVLAH